MQCVCVCVCERERESERANSMKEERDENLRILESYCFDKLEIGEESRVIVLNNAK